MGYEEHPRSGSAGVVIALVVGLVLLLLAGLAVVGVGALFWVRTRTEVRQATVAEAEAIQAQERALVELKRLEAEVAPAPVASPMAQAAPQREITITLDADGNITVNGESATADRLNDVLKEAQQGEAVTAVIKADRRCDFGHVAAVQDACLESGIEAIRFAVAE